MSSNPDKRPAALGEKLLTEATSFLTAALSEIWTLKIEVLAEPGRWVRVEYHNISQVLVL